MTYRNTRCWKCDSDIVVATHDYAERNYCQSCAWDKLYDNRTVETANE